MRHAGTLGIALLALVSAVALAGGPEASCTAGRASFVIGQLPVHTGLTTVGQAGSPIGLKEELETKMQSRPGQ